MRDNDDWLLTSYWPGTSSPESQKNSESSSASTPSPCRWTQYLFYILFVTRKHKPRETGTEPGLTPTSPPSPWGSPGAWRPSRLPLTGILSMSWQLVLTFTRRLSKHHIRHIKAYDPNEGKVCWEKLFSVKNIIYFWMKYTMYNCRIMRGVWLVFTRPPASMTSAPEWPTGAAASGILSHKI